MISLNTDLKSEQALTTATVINGVVSDLLAQHQIDGVQFPEIVDLAVVVTGLGMLQSNFEFVKSVGAFWDSTRWNVAPRPFLDRPSLAYAYAMAAWTRDEKSPSWSSQLPNDIKRPMAKSLKYLFKTSDCFFDREGSALMVDRSPLDWLNVAKEDSASRQIVGLRFLQGDESYAKEQEALLLDRLQSENEAVVLFAISAAQRLSVTAPQVVDELRMLVTHRNNEIRAKAMCALARLGVLDEATIETASKLLESKVKYVAYSGLLALSTMESVPEFVVPPANRGFNRSLQACDYEFVGLYAAAFHRWLDDPQSHFEHLLQENSPEYLEIALEALQKVKEELVGIG